MGIFDLVRGGEPEKQKAKIEEEIRAKAVIDFTNPFSKEHIQSVRVCIRKDWRGNIVFEATVSYEIGKSSGDHKIEADSFQSLVDKVNVYINNIGA